MLPAPAPPVDAVLAGFRVALVQGDRNSQAWALANAGHGNAAVAEHFGISRERARQVIDRARKLLSTWPEPSAWAQALPLRLRELCLSVGINDAEALRQAVAEGRRPAIWWTMEDVAAAQRAAGLEPTADPVREALRRVLAALHQVTDALDALVAAGIVGARALRQCLAVLERHALAIHDDLREDARAADSAASTGENNNVE